MSFRFRLIAPCIGLAALFASSGCAGRGLKTIELRQGEREALVYVPAIARAAGARRPVPMILVLHGGGGKPRGIARMTRHGFQRMADKLGFIVVFPGGIDRGWNDGRTVDINTSTRDRIDDVGFIKNLIERLAGEYSVDRTKVFATGMSNGGFMSMRLACDLSDTIRGVALVTAQLSRDLAEKCRPARPVRLMIINGTEDPLVPYGGGEIKVLGKARGEILSTQATIERFRRFNRCGSARPARLLPDHDPDDGTRTTRIDYDCPAPGRVSLVRVDGGGHTWPGGRPYLPRKLVGRVSHDLDAVALITDFFLAP